MIMTKNTIVTDGYTCTATVVIAGGSFPTVQGGKVTYYNEAITDPTKSVIIGVNRSAMTICDSCGEVPEAFLSHS
jgi:hypothetical protein